MKLAKKPKVATPAKAKNATPKKAKETPQKKQNNNDLTLQPGGESLDPARVRDALKALFKVKESKEGDGGGDLFSSEEGDKVQLQVSGIKLPRDDRRHAVKVPLPHSPLPDPHDVCLIVKDLEKGIRADHEPTAEHFRDLLEAKGAKGLVHTVMPLRELKVEYKVFEAKTQLCHKFDKFLVDDRVARLVPKFLGKPFYKRRKLPVAVNLKAKDLQKELSQGLRTATLPLTHHGNSSLVTIGHAGMGAEQLEQNVLAAGEVLAKRYPGGWKNLRSVHLKTESSVAIPLHVSLASANDVGFVDASLPKRERHDLAKGELSTQPGMEVTVLPSGKVKIDKTADPEWDDENDQPFVEGSDSEDESEEDEETKKEDKKKAKKRKAEETKKEKSKNKKAKEESEDESDEDMEAAEMEYMQKVAEEEEEIEKKEAKGGEAEEEEEESGEEKEEGEEDDEDDDDEEDSDDLDDDDVVVDEDDDSGSDNADSDEELMMRANGGGDDEEEDDDDEDSD